MFGLHCVLQGIPRITIFLHHCSLIIYDIYIRKQYLKLTMYNVKKYIKLTISKVNNV